MALFDTDQQRALLERTDKPAPVSDLLIYRAVRVARDSCGPVMQQTARAYVLRSGGSEDQAAAAAALVLGEVDWPVMG